MKYFILVMPLTLIVIAACGKQVELSGSSKTVKQVASNASAARQVYALEELKLPVFENHLKQVSGLNGATVENKIALWKPDLSDIGRTITAEFENETSQKETATFEVLPPKIKVKDKCEYEPPSLIGSVQPQESWSWAGWKNTDPSTMAGAPNLNTTYSAPIVADLDGDGFSEIILSPGDGIGPSYLNYAGFDTAIVVLSAKTKDVVWNSIKDADAQHPAIYNRVNTSVAVADLDGSGPKIISTSERISPTVTSSMGINIVDFKTRKLVKRFEDAKLNPGGYGVGPTIADIDGDGKPEIMYSNVVLNQNGDLKFWLQSNPPRVAGFVVADFDKNEPGLELIMGSYVFSAKDGRLLFSGGKDSNGQDMTCNGFEGAADLDGDGNVELVCVQGGKVRVYSQNKFMAEANLNINTDIMPVGSTCLVTRNAPQGKYEVLTLKDKNDLNFTATGIFKNEYAPPSCPAVHGGAPNIGSFLGNGKLQIGVAGGFFYQAFEYKNGKLSVLWKNAIRDYSSAVTGSSLFDLNGDGKVEVLYNDERGLHIYDGVTGKELFTVMNASGTAFEYPVVANIDGPLDPAVEIILAGGGSIGIDDSPATYKALRVLKGADVSKKWVTSRSFWNQYNYNPNLINDNLGFTNVSNSTSLGLRVNFQTVVADVKEGKTLLPNLSVLAPLFYNTDGVLSFFIQNTSSGSSTTEGTLEVLSADGKTLASQSFGAIKTGEGSTIKVQGIKDVSNMHAKIKLTPMFANAPAECDFKDNEVNVSIQSKK